MAQFALNKNQFKSLNKFIVLAYLNFSTQYLSFYVSYFYLQGWGPFWQGLFGFLFIMRPLTFKFLKKCSLTQITFFRKVKETNIHSERF